ncbi:MAG: hypothetical protein SPL22_08580 [Treponema sp.]|uniref:hypothetical protein n=1 Tax=Treponema sp. TaxID=166 RepID=UPI002A909701|nr:hypothetical protein [Treponema sp.]MDY6397774.1 hypothetical protein [Treponema sp.]
MNKLIHMFTKLYESEGYSSVLKAYSEWSNDFHELNDWELISLKLYIAKLAVVNKDINLVKSLIILDDHEEIENNYDYSACPSFQKSFDKKCKYLEIFHGRSWCSIKGDWCNIREINK